MNTLSPKGKSVVTDNGKADDYPIRALIALTATGKQNPNSSLADSSSNKAADQGMGGSV
ncbi:MAG TPA: hypothetical protein VK487_05700 [Candidatus Bathyarchaeia archaeon]|nr:hypothetical protein [Candidatus Bathyarchaeia archaeon]